MRPPIEKQFDKMQCKVLSNTRWSGRHITTSCARTMQYAADIEACRNGQQFSAKASSTNCLASMKSSCCASSAAKLISVATELLAGIMDRTLVIGLEWMEVETGTDTTVPNDGDDVASFSSQQNATIWFPKPVTFVLTLVGRRAAV